MRTDADGLLVTRFAATYDHLDTSDWADVLRRGTPVRRRKRRVLLIAVAVALIIVPISIAFGGAIHDLFFGSPAPPIIKRSFAEQNEMRVKIRQWAAEHHRGDVFLPPHVDPSQARGVISVKTTDGPLFLWAAPTSGGRECWFVSFAKDTVGHKRASGTGSCDQGKPKPSGDINWGYGWSASHPTLKVLSGRLYLTNAVAILADIGTSRPVRVPVVDRYFLRVFPREVKVKSVSAIDRDDEVLAKSP